jgi:hypothetical protein
VLDNRVGGTTILVERDFRVQRSEDLDGATPANTEENTPNRETRRSARRRRELRCPARACQRVLNSTVAPTEVVRCWLAEPIGRSLDGWSSEQSSQSSRCALWHGHVQARDVSSGKSTGQGGARSALARGRLLGFVCPLACVQETKLNHTVSRLCPGRPGQVQRAICGVVASADGPAETSKAGMLPALLHRAFVSSKGGVTTRHVGPCHYNSGTTRIQPNADRLRAGQELLVQT